MKINQLSVDLMQDQASIGLNDEEGSFVNVIVKIQTPGNQPENRLKETARAAAKAALRAAIEAL